MFTDNVAVPSSLSDVELQNVLQAWQGIALDELRPIIDRQALTMKASEERSQRARKHLAKLLKILKQVQQSEHDQTSVKKSVAATIKSFQNEVDELTKRSAYAESCFQQIYTKLYLAPDPCAALLMAPLYIIEHKRSLELEQKVREYESELRIAKSQEVTVRELEQRLKRPCEDDALQSKFESQIKKLEHENDRLVKESKLRESLLHQEIQKCRDLLSKTQAQLHDSQAALVLIHDRKEKEDASREQFINSVNEELLSAKSQVATLRHENSILKASLSHASAILSNETLAEVNQRSLESQQQLSQLLRSYNASLQENESLRQQLMNESSSKAAIEKKYQADTELLQAKVESLTATIGSLPSLEEFDSVKKQLKFYLDIDSEGQIANDLKPAVLTETQKPQSEFTRSKLECVSFRKQLEGEMTPSDIIQPNTKHENSKAHVYLFDQMFSRSSNMSYSQRDRYKKALESFEMEKITLQTRNDSLLQQLNTIKNDNENLYLRLQAAQRANNKGVDLESATDVEKKYARIVNDKRNPFAKFIRDQNCRSYDQSNVIERLILKSTKVLLGYKTLRTAGFFYIIALHALVFFSLVTHTIISHCPQNAKH